MKTIVFNVKRVKDTNNYKVKFGRKIKSDFYFTGESKYRFAINPSAQGGLYFEATTFDDVLREIKECFENFINNICTDEPVEIKFKLEANEWGKIEDKTLAI